MELLSLHGVQQPVEDEGATAKRTARGSKCINYRDSTNSTTKKGKPVSSLVVGELMFEQQSDWSRGTNLADQ